MPANISRVHAAMSSDQSQLLLQKLQALLFSPAEPMDDLPLCSEVANMVQVRMQLPCQAHSRQSNVQTALTPSSSHPTMILYIG